MAVAPGVWPALELHEMLVYVGHLPCLRVPAVHAPVVVVSVFPVRPMACPCCWCEHPAGALRPALRSHMSAPHSTAGGTP